MVVVVATSAQFPWILMHVLIDAQTGQTSALVFGPHAFQGLLGGLSGSFASQFSPQAELRFSYIACQLRDQLQHFNVQIVQKLRRYCHILSVYQ